MILEGRTKKSRHTERKRQRRLAPRLSQQQLMEIISTYVPVLVKSKCVYVRTIHSCTPLNYSTSGSGTTSSRKCSLETWLLGL